METDGPVRIEILARGDCPSRGMAIAVVERVVDETGVPAKVEVIDVETIAQATELGFLGSPTIRVEGRDVDRRPTGEAAVSLDDRVYRTSRGLSGWPDIAWVREAILLAVAGSKTNGDHTSFATSSSTSP